MQIEYKIKFEDGGVTITQTVEPSHRAGVDRRSSARPGRQLGSTLMETQHLDTLAGGPNDQGRGGGPGPNDPGVGGGPNDPGVGGGPNDPGVGGGPNDPGVGGSSNDPVGGVGGRATISHGCGHAAGASGKVSAVILGPTVISGF